MKDRILQSLKQTGNQYVSGEALSERLGVSRTAVWKYIKELRKEGYLIESSSKKGYRLVSVPDILNSGEISYNLGTSLLGQQLYFFNTIDSTNTYAKRIAGEGCPDGTVVIADCQTEGRGRMGRIWESAGNKGIWMSVVLRPTAALEDIPVFTMAASVAVVRAVRKETGITTGIKWPNDIILEGKKVCGILTEASSELERVNFLVIGIGLNVNHEEGDFPELLKTSATSLKLFRLGDSIKPVPENGNIHFNRSELIKTLLFELEAVYIKLNTGDIAGILDEWKDYSVTLGKEVKVTAKGTEFSGVANDITKDGKLVVTCTDGITREIQSGEISVRGLLGYI